MQTATPSPPNCNLKQKHYNLRYEIKTGQQKKYEPAATKKGRSFTPLSNPTATKNQSTKKLKEVTGTKLERRFAAAESHFVQPQPRRKQEMQHQNLPQIERLCLTKKRRLI